MITFSKEANYHALECCVLSEGKWRYTTRSSYGLTFGDVVFESGFLNVLTSPDELNPTYAIPQKGITFLPAEYWCGAVVLGRTDSWPAWTKEK